VWLGSWQLADALMDRGEKSDDTGTTHTTDSNDKNSEAHKPVKPLTIEAAREYVVEGSAQAAADVGKTYDDDPSSYWRTKSYTDGPRLAPYKPGVGIVYDLGSAKSVSAASIALLYPGNHTTVHLYAADSLSPSASVSSMKEIGSATTSDKKVSLKGKKSVKTQYVLLWITDVPYASGDNYSGSGYKQAITDVTFRG
jgi:hypothetical protein